MKLSITEMYGLYKAQEAYDKQSKRSFKLSLLLVKNTKILKAELTEFEETRKKLIETEDFVEYAKKREDLINAHRIKKEDGSFETKVQNGQTVFPLINVDVLSKKLNEFDAELKHKHIIDANKKSIAEVEATMDEKHELPLACITSAEQIQFLEAQTLVTMAPVIKVKLTEEVLGDKLASELTAADLTKLAEYCEIG